MLVVSPITDRVKAAYRMVSKAGSKRDSFLAIDIGCGLGEATRYFNARDIKTIGLEASKDSIEEAILRDGQSNSYLRGDALNIPFKSGRFEVVLLLDVIEHLPPGSEEAALTEIRRILKGNGILVLSTPNKGLLRFTDPQNLAHYLPGFVKEIASFFWSRKKVDDYWQSPYHRKYSKKELEELFTKNGFEVIDCQYRKTGLPNIPSILFDNDNRETKKVKTPEG